MTKKRIRTVENWITIVFFGLIFLSMSIYLCIYVKNNEQTLIGNSYNSRQKLLARENIRGRIYDSDGNLLAETLTNEAGEEYRSYPYHNLYAHAVGFSNHGTTGIESMAGFYLINSDISLNEKMENDMAGRKNPGNNVYTTFDTDLQNVASDALGVCKGAVIVTEVKTGRILAMVSKPDFDPNTIPENWNAYVNNPQMSVLLNRTTQGLYPPGSTFKIITSLEYLRENPTALQDYTYTCNGKYVDEAENIDISCYHGSVHGKLDFVGSFAKSCNSSFANIGMSLDKDKFGNTLNGLLFNSGLPIEYNYSQSDLKVDSKTSDYDMAQISIGQGDAIITPIHLNLITSAIANKGVMMKPRVIDRVTDGNGKVIKTYADETEKRVMSEDEAKALSLMMEAVVLNGTGRKLQNDHYTAAGKTGSAEFNGNKEDAHAWFTGFAPVDDPEISVTIIVEGIGSGGDYAVPIARRIFNCYYGID